MNHFLGKLQKGVVPWSDWKHLGIPKAQPTCESRSRKAHVCASPEVHRMHLQGLPVPPEVASCLLYFCFRLRIPSAYTTTVGELVVAVFRGVVWQNKTWRVDF